MSFLLVGMREEATSYRTYELEGVVSSLDVGEEYGGKDELEK